MTGFVCCVVAMLTVVILATVPRPRRAVSLASAIVAGMAIGLAVSGRAHATPCDAGPINPLTKTSWQSIFPISVGGVEIKGPASSRQPNLDQDESRSPICVCPSPTIGLPTPGLRIKVWVPNHQIDTTENPGCLGALGVDIIPDSDLRTGTTSKTSYGSDHVFTQVHYYYAPIWAMLDLFTDLPCIKESGFDVAFLSEIDPTHHNEVLGALMYPETVLFANPASVLSCMADAVVANANHSTVNPLFWCMGSWGTTYPMGGWSKSTDYAEANAHIAGKAIFKMSRLGALWVSDGSACYERPMPIWQKSHFKIQEMVPVKQSVAMNIGQAGIQWSSLKAPPQNTNFTWAVFEKKFCCANP